MLQNQNQNNAPAISLSPKILPTTTIHANDNSATEESQLFFEMFDVKETGYIDLDELKFVIGCLLRNEMKNMSREDYAVSQSHMEELFLTINVGKSGHINLVEFQKFYNSVMMSTSKLRFSRASLQEVLRNRKSIITE